MSIIFSRNKIKLFRYIKNGKFDYQLYKKIQIEDNKKKLHVVFAKEEYLKLITDYCLDHLKEKKIKILCHGTRNGFEQSIFKKYIPKCEILGTDISPTGVNFPMTIVWDFHKYKKEWINKYNLIYSNSWDHSYDPENCFNVWIKCLSKNGLLILEHTNSHGPSSVSAMDPFGIDFHTFLEKLIIWGKSKYYLHDLIKTYDKRNTTFIIIKKI